MFDNVFISYAREDASVATELFDFLDSKGYNPWLDTKSILPGQDWDNETRKALKKADYVILLLSNRSVNKRGYVQREFKLALSYLEERLESDIYLLPCKIDDCVVPENFLKFQCVELESQDAHSLIYKALEHQRNKYLQQQSESNSAFLFDYTEIVVKKKIGGNPAKSVEIRYPQFLAAGNDDIDLLNTIIKSYILNDYGRFRTPFSSDLLGKEDPGIDFPDFFLEYNYRLEVLSKSLISFTIFYHVFEGGAHGNYKTKGFTFKLDPLTEISFVNLFDNDVTVLNTLRGLCIDKLMIKAEREWGITDAKGFFFDRSPVPAKWETFSNYFIRPNAVVVLFGTYQESAYVFGEHEVVIEFDEILRYHPRLSTLNRLQSLL